MLNVKTIEWSDLLLLNQMGVFVKYGWEEPQTHRKQSVILPKKAFKHWGTVGGMVFQTFR